MIPRDLIITIDDVRRVFCVRGARGWFEQNGLNFRHFLDNGIAATTLAAVDAHGLAVVHDRMARDAASTENG
ncbi:hypothetical protein U1872_06385 [Sphingomonas sp. RB3P16]|uniref:hypothetical protein n=1 Tax=Parasphingomonas frigoris TaxID=3096163 RepID=UPI002FC7CF2B